MPARRHSRSLALEPEQFERLVQQAIDGVPKEYRHFLENVAIIIEEEPSQSILDELGVGSNDDLLGLYSGTSRHDDSFFNAGGQLPSRISIYRGPILRLCRSADEVVQEVRDTVVHEIGHHFGLDDEEMPY